MAETIELSREIESLAAGFDGTFAVKSQNQNFVNG
jgi:hypothetical protein